MELARGHAEAWKRVDEDARGMASLILGVVCAIHSFAISLDRKNQLASSSPRFHASACPLASSIDSMERSSEQSLIVRDVRNWHEGWLHCLLGRWIFRAFQKIERIGTQL